MPRKKILWVCSWYPSRAEPFNGDFIQRHARAASGYDDIHVIHVASFNKRIPGIIPYEERVVSSSLTEHIIYLERRGGILSKFRNYFRLQGAYKRALAAYQEKNKITDLVHLHVPLPAGIAALQFSKKYKIPLLITEHWGIYNEVVTDNYSKRSRIFRALMKKLFRSAILFTSVSHFLAERIRKMVISLPYRVIPNTVDTTHFFYQGSSGHPFRFIHVSNMVPLKNIRGLLRAFKSFSEIQAAELVMVGDTSSEYREYAEYLGLLNKNVFFKGEVSYPEVARQMQESDCLVLFSDIENSPCVISEALCCGLPVIATNVGGIPELVNRENGLLVQAGNEEELSRCFQEMIKKYPTFNRVEIARVATGRFSFLAVGEQFSRLYREFD